MRKIFAKFYIDEFKKKCLKHNQLSLFFDIVPFFIQNCRDICFYKTDNICLKSSKRFYERFYDV